MNFRITSHLSEIIEESEKHPVIIFKYSNSCGTSDILKKKLEESKIGYPVFLLIVQEMPVLSKNVEDIFSIKHESPQVIVLEKGKVTYYESHHKINLGKIVKI